MIRMMIPTAGMMSGILGLGGGAGGLMGSLGGMLGGLGQGLGLLGGIFGGSQERARRAQAERVSQIMRELRARRGTPAVRAQEAMRIQKKRLAAVEQSFDRAAAETRGAGRQAEQEVGLASRQASSAATQNALSRGMTGSSVDRNMQRGIAADTARTVGGIRTGVGNALGGIAMNRAGAVSGVMGDMANIPWMQGAMDERASGATTDFLRSIQHASSGGGGWPVGAGSLLQGIGGFFGSGGGWDSLSGGFRGLFGR